jgi:anti-sigma B factor antagonist
MHTGSREHARNLSITGRELNHGIRLFELTGELDQRSADSLQDALDDAIDRGASRVVLDLSGLTFCDSTGLRAIVAGYHALTMAGGRLSIVCDDDRILRVFRVTRLDRLLAVSATREQAIEHFESAPPPRRWRRFSARPAPARPPRPAV